VPAGDRRIRVLAELSGGAGSDLSTKRLCEGCADVMGMSGAGIMLMSASLPRGSVCTSNDVSALIGELQYTLGEGPSVDAYLQGWPVLEPDLADPSNHRWLGFSAPAVEAGVRAIFGFPMHVGSVRLGALDVYRARPGRLSDDQHADALVIADVAARALLVMQAQAPPGALAIELEAGADFRYVVHQASGMVAAQLNVGVGEALVALRAYAFSSDRPLVDVAGDVLSRRLRFDDGDEAQIRPR
jgi:hypothetical protein